jgi:subtilisin-like proprotein convertase family protein
MLPFSHRRATVAAGLVLALAASSAAVLAPSSASAAPGPDDVRRDFSATQQSLGGVPDSPAGAATDCGVAGTPLDVVVPVSGISAGSALTDLEVTAAFTTHNWMGDVTMTLISPDGGSEFPLFGRTGAGTPTSCGDPSNLAGSYTFSDQASTEWSATAANPLSEPVMPPGTYRSAAVGSPGGPTLLTPQFTSVPDLNGNWILRVTDSGKGDTTSVTSASLGLSVDESCPAARDALALAQSDLVAVEQALTTAQQAVGAADVRLRLASKAVRKADKALKKAKKAKKNRQGKVAKAKQKLKKAQQTKRKKATALKVAIAAAASAEAEVTTAESAVAAAQSDVDSVCSD